MKLKKTHLTHTHTNDQEPTAHNQTLRAHTPHTPETHQTQTQPITPQTHQTQTQPQTLSQTPPSPPHASDPLAGDIFLLLKRCTPTFTPD